MQAARKFSSADDAFLFVTQFHLPAVRMAAQRQVNSLFLGLAKDDRIVRKQYLDLVRVRAFQRGRDIRLPDHMIVNSGEPERSSVAADTQSFVDEHLDALAAEDVGHEFGIRPVIVIAEAGVCAHRRAELSKHFGDGRDERAVVRNVITGQEHDVGL